MNALLSDGATSSSVPAQSVKVPQRASLPWRNIAGVAVSLLTEQEAVWLLNEAISTLQHLRLAFCNAHLVNIAATDDGFRERLKDFLVVPDGLGIDIASRLLYGVPFPANLNGTDFIPALFGSRQTPLRVALLGGRPGVAERAAARLHADHPQHRFEVLSHGYFRPDEEAALLTKLEQERPDVLLIAFGNPRQEDWISAKIRPCHCTLVAGVGALFDFLAGEVARAPAPLRRIRMEWLYRLWLEPARLWRRYVIGNPIFLARMLRLRLFGPHSP